MPNPVTSSGIRDNHKRGVVADFLKAKIQSGSRLSVVSAYFTIYAYEALKERLDQTPFEFQRDGVKCAINKILKHDGCIL